MLRVIKVIRLSGCVSSSFKALERESKPRKSGEKWRVDGGRKKKKKRINCLTMMVFFSHGSERLDQKALKRESA